MLKTEVYSWRVAPEIKSALEHEARRANKPMAELLDRIAQDWLAQKRLETSAEDAEQARLHAAAKKVFGAFGGGNPRRSEQARDAVRARLAKRRAG